MPKINHLVANAGDCLTIQIVKCEVVEGVAGEDVKFTTARGDIYINRKTADRRLARIGFGEIVGTEITVFYGDVDGNWLTFARTENTKVKGGKPFWEIERAEAPTRGRPESEVPPPSDADAPEWDENRIGDLPGDPAHPTTQDRLATRRAEIIDAYRIAYAAAFDVMGPEAPFDSVQAGAATLLIAFQKAGVA